MSRPNIEIVQRAYEGYTRRSVDLDEIAPDFTFHMRPEFPARNAYRIDEMPKVWADLDETFTDDSLTPRDFTEIGDHVLVTLDSSTRMKDSDVRVQSTIFHLWLVRDGTALEAWTHSSRDEAVEFATRRENVELIRRGFELWGMTVGEDDEDAFSELLEHYAPDAVVDFSRTALDFPRATGPDGMTLSEALDAVGLEA